MINYRPPRGMVVPIQVSDVHALLPPLHGTGFLSGTITDDGAPVVATIRALWRPPGAETLQGVICGQTTSATDGTWRIDDINPELTYTAVASMASRNDAIAVNITPRNPPRLAATTATATVGQPLDYALPIIGGVGTVTATLTSGTPPSGVTYGDGKLTGTHPTGATGDYTLTFDLIDDNETVTATITLTLVLLPITLSALDPVPATLTLGEAMTPVRFRARGGEGGYTIAVDAGALPTGTSLTTIDSETVEWSGTPAAGSYSFVLKATGVRGTPDTKSYSVSVAANYATLNPADKGNNVVLSEGNLLAYASGGDGYLVRSTAEITGKVYFEAKFLVATTGTGTIAAGVANLAQSLNSSFYNTANGWAMWGTGSGARHNSALTFAKTIANNDTVGFAVDQTVGKIWISVNGVWLTGDPAAGTSPMWSDLNGQLYAAAFPWSSGNKLRMHFDPAEFDYPAPSGFGPLTE